jgi:hypothetical protein
MPLLSSLLTRISFANVVLISVPLEFLVYT